MNKKYVPLSGPSLKPKQNSRSVCSDVHADSLVRSGRNWLATALEDSRGTEIHDGTETVSSRGNCAHCHETGGFEYFKIVLVHSGKIQ